MLTPKGKQLSRKEIIKALNAIETQKGLNKFVIIATTGS